jgi:hypothetical protein
LVETGRWKLRKQSWNHETLEVRKMLHSFANLASKPNCKITPQVINKTVIKQSKHQPTSCSFA